MRGILQGARCSIDRGRGDPSYGTIVTDLTISASGEPCYGVLISGKVRLVSTELIFNIDDNELNKA